MIESARGNAAGARMWLERALEINPGFDVADVRTARETLASLP
jgi:hypothetical protein